MPLNTELYKTFLEEQSKVYTRSGMINGRMGFSICFFHLFRINNNSECEDLGMQLLEEEYENISRMSILYETGLTGFGTGIIWLLHNKFVEGDMDDILGEIDFMVQCVPNRRLIESASFMNGVCGIVFYLYSRIKFATDQESLQTLRNKLCMIKMIDWIESFLTTGIDQKDLNDIYFILTRVHTLNIYNSKIDRLLKKCLEAFDFSDLSTLNDNYEFMGIPHLKLLKSWI